MFRKKWLKKIVPFLLILFLVGCAKVTDTVDNNSTTPASPPAGTTDVTFSGGNVSASGTSLSLNMFAKDQGNSPLTNITRGNLQAEIYTSYPTTGISAAQTQGAISVIIDDLRTSSQAIAAGLTIDKSGSMSGSKIATAAAAAKMFVDLMDGQNDMATVVGFYSSAVVEAPMTSDKAVLAQAIEGMIASGNTAIYDAIMMTIDEIKAYTSKTRAIVLLTDGEDNSSVTTLNGAINEAIAQGIPIYTVGLFDDQTDANNYSPPLKQIAKDTTGTEDNYFEIIVGVTGISLSEEKMKALSRLIDYYTSLKRIISDAYTARCTLSEALVTGQTYYLKVTLDDYGQFEESIVIQFVAK